MQLENYRSLTIQNNTKILFLVMDGLGGLPQTPDGKTELETARTPHLNALVTEGISGLHVPVAEGITPGSGPGHCALFGYDPCRYMVGRGVLSAAGIGFELEPDDVAARGNFCTIDSYGNVTDRRAGRIDTEKNRLLCDKLRTVRIPGVDLAIETIKEHRFLLRMRGDNISDELDDTDPQQTGVSPRSPHPRTLAAQHTADLLARFLRVVRETLNDEEQANMVLLRGFSKPPSWPRFPEVFGLRSAAIAAYPMYRGLAKLLGMDVLPQTGDTAEELHLAVKHSDEYDFLFFHIKQTDSSGEDGNFTAKVRAIEEVDTILPRLRALEPDVVIVTGDHATPAVMRSHSWHPVPVLLWSKNCRPDDVWEFGERMCLRGSLGPRFATKDLMPLACAHAGRLQKYGA